MVWPLARRDALAFIAGKREILVVERSAASSRAS